MDMDMTKNARTVITNSNKLARILKNEYETPEHIFYAMLYQNKSKKILSSCQADLHYLRKELKSFLKNHVPINGATIEPIKTVSYKQLLERAERLTKYKLKNKIDIDELLISIYSKKFSYIYYLLQKAGVSQTDIENIFKNDNTDTRSAIIPISDNYTNEKEDKNKKKDAIEIYTEDLTELARNNELPPVIGLYEETERIINILFRKHKNNPMIIGEPGVGKTAIVEGLAQRIVKGDVPDKLKDATILSLNLTKLVSGSSMVGDFEKKFQDCFEQIQRTENSILFIDEVHTLIGAGSSSKTCLDASNLLKPIIAKGLRCIAATTIQEYKKYIEPEAAFARRFNAVFISQPSEETTITILQGLKPHYEEYHNVIYDDNALEAAVRLSSRYIQERYLPDKAIDIMDEAAAMARIKAGNSSASITVDQLLIEKLIATKAQIPQQTVSKREAEKLETLARKLQENIFGQQDAIESVVKAIINARSGFRSAKKSLANILFVGPTGVGKTELAKTLAESLSIDLIRFDMSEYQEKHSVAKLIGAPPGYVGYEEGGLLTEAVRKTPYAVVLFDEIEKAHPDIFNTLLQVMDYATLTDNTGKKADFRNVIIIMTSNAGASDKENVAGFGNHNIGDSAIDTAIKKIFTPEFRNRIDEVVHFEQLTQDNIVSIVQKELQEFKDLLLKKNITLTVTNTCIDKLVEESYSREFGARNVARIIEKKIKIFAKEVLFGRLTSGGSVTVDWRDGDYYIDILSERQ